MKKEKVDRYANPLVSHLIPEDELTQEQIDRQDEVGEAIHRVINALIPPQYAEKTDVDDAPIEWDIEPISEVREMIENIIWEKLNLNEFSRNASDSQTRREQFEMNFYPFLKTEEE